MALIPIKEEPSQELEERRSTFELKNILFIISLISLFFLLIFLPDIPIIKDGLMVGIRPLIILLIIILIISRSVVKFNEYERGVVFRLGRFKEVAGPGWCIIFPIMERYVRVDLRLQVYTIDPREVVTKDKVRFLVSAEVFMYVSNPKDAVINVRDYKKAVLQYISSALTHICGNSTSDYIIAHMDEVSRMLEESIHHMAEREERRWGIVVPRVKLTMVRFPERVQSAMHEKVAAEQLKLAAHEKAEATKIEIDAIREAGSKLTDPAITYLYLEALDKVARGKATKIVLPLEIAKIAETITRRATPQEFNLPAELIENYKRSMDRYEKRIKDIENRLKEGKTTQKDQER